LDFNPCMKHKVVRKTVRKFAEAELGPIAHEIDSESRFPWEVIEKMPAPEFFRSSGFRGIRWRGYGQHQLCHYR